MPASGRRPRPERHHELRFPRAATDAAKTRLFELVAQLVAKYDIEKIAAQRDVDALMNGRNLTV